MRSIAPSKLILVLVPFLTTALMAQTAPTGKVVGTIIDEFNGMTLPMAPIEALQEGTLVYSELDGRYSIELPSGTHELKVTFSGYEDRTIKVEVASGQTVTRDISMGLLRFKEEVVVTAKAETPRLFTSEAQLIERRKSSVIADTMAAEDMRKNADSNAASAMQRVTGLTVVDNQYVFVRGLGERYSTTTLNGATLPTTEPDKKVVPLDLFPSGLIQRVQVVKSYTPDKPADFAGGLVEIEPLNFPDQLLFDFSFSQGFNGQTTFKTVGDYPGGSLDWLGFDDGTRALPGVIPADQKVVRGNQFTDLGFTPEELQTFGRSFANVWDPRPAQALQNQSYSMVVGNSGEKLGGVFSFSYANKKQYHEEEQNFYKVSADTITLQNDYDFQISEAKTTTGLVGNLAYKLDGNNRLAFENFYTHNSKNETRLFAGFNNDLRSDIIDSRLSWIEETIFSNKISGEHFLPGMAGSRLDWRFNVSHADRDEPDLRETLYEFNPVIDKFVLADESQSGFRMFNDLKDRVYELAADWSFFATQWSGLPTMVKFGPYLQLRDRDFSSRRFRFNPRNLSGLDISQPPEVLFARENIGTRFELREETRPTDTYVADQSVTSFYGMVDLPLAESWRLVGGARVERSDQTVDTFDPFNTEGEMVTAGLNDTDVLPGLNLIYSVHPDVNLRIGYSHTVNRPEFRELAPFEFTDVVGGRAVVGNPELQRALIKNLDLRMEWFPSTSEVIAASFFYKDFDNPIERVVQPTAQLRTSYANAAGARNAGLEVEARKQLSRNLLASVNYTFVDSNIDIGRATGEVQTSIERPLAGQSANVFNGLVEFSLPRWELSTRLLYNFFGDRINDVGSLGLPDIIEKGRGSLDLIVVKRFGDAQLRAVFDNLTDAEHVYSQAGELQRAFKLGPAFALSFSYSVY